MAKPWQWWKLISRSILEYWFDYSYQLIHLVPWQYPTDTQRHWHYCTYALSISRNVRYSTWNIHSPWTMHTQIRCDKYVCTEHGNIRIDKYVCAKRRKQNFRLVNLFKAFETNSNYIFSTSFPTRVYTSRVSLFIRLCLSFLLSSFSSFLNFFPTPGRWYKLRKCFQPIEILKKKTR